MISILIDEVDLWQIKKVLAFPDANNLLLSDDQIKIFCIYPALQEYFRKFPVEQEYQTPINGELILNFPDELTFGVKDGRVTDLGIIGGTGTQFWDLVYYQQVMQTSVFRKGSGAYGIKGYNPNGINQLRDLQRYNMKSYQNLYTTIKFKVDYQNRTANCYSSQAGVLNLVWAKYSNNFNDVKYTYKPFVYMIAQAYLLEHLSDTAGILSDAALDVTINIDALKSRAQELREKVKEVWDAHQDIILLHSV